MRKIILFLGLAFIMGNFIRTEDGYRLWLRYNLITDTQVLCEYCKLITGYYIDGNSETKNAAKEELEFGLNGLLGKDINRVEEIAEDGIIIIVTPDKSALLTSLNIADKLSNIGEEGYIITSAAINNKKNIVITANNEVGLLYGVFHFLRLLQTHQHINNIDIESSPKIKVRVLNHWDNLDRTVERGYAGFSIWDWHRLPDYFEPRYKDYARANASIGINGMVLTNVNADAFVLTNEYLLKVAALADVFRPYGIKVYLTGRFSAPVEIGGLKTADPLEPAVQNWWNEKAKEIYELIPDFGGFLVKANSEGQPGPQNYGRTHTDGANMLADAVKPFGGIVMWRAFVYSFDIKEDRAKQAYNEFQPLDGKFRDNILIQVKNGAIDFQPREPFHPLFGAMPQTPLMMEFQITQEYLGQGTSLTYLSSLYKEVLESDTYADGKGSTVAKIIDGTLDSHSLSGIAGVSNIGTDRNWTGHTFGQANWYAFGRLAWDHELTSEQIADEWIRMTFSNNSDVLDLIKSLMLNSHETVVNYMTPLGLHHIMGWDHHYGPAPWIKDKHRDDWTSVYYHGADRNGIGFDRTATGSNAVSQYFPSIEKMFSSLEICPDKYLLWFHHLNWNYVMKSGNTLWNELCYKYYEGVDSVKSMQRRWNSLTGKIDKERFESVRMLLNIQVKEAKWWRNACLLYFQTFSNQPIPVGLEKPDKSLEYYQNLNFPYAPGIRPRW
ncbi:MAG: alpha-glucuronidase [Ignavibacteria bacterium RBG_13_36_8]|nr:MAG: alpha-glucuronidase [Ignavibacteria bacterium RBG_13_36_8]